MTNTWNDPNAHSEANKYQNPIPSRLLILQTVAKLINEGMAATAESLGMHFEILGDEEKFFALNNRLKAMLRDGQLIREDGIHFGIAPLPNIVRGKITSNAKGFGFLVLDDIPDLFVHEKQMRVVFDGDEVEAVANEFRGKPEARIINVIKRAHNEFIGILTSDDEGFMVQLGGANAHQPITLTDEDVAHWQAELGDSVKVAIIDFPTYQEYATGKITERLTGLNDRELIIETTVHNHGIPDEFSAAALEQAHDYKEPSATERKGRTDLRELPLITIDGEDARDFDDAVFAEKRAGGNYRVVVAIADVSHYVTPNSPLDVDAYERSTSVYFPHRVIPMLPEVLSNGLCSLNPKVDRLCMVADIKLSRAGNVTGYEFYPAVMHSKARLTYNQVNAFFDDPSNETLPDDLVRNPDVIKSVDTLHQIYQILDKKREERGAMAFETAETYIVFGEDGDIKDIKARTRGDAHKLIEEMMLLANTCAANFALKHELPVLYRNHDKPSDEKALRLSDYVKTFGLAFPSENPTHTDYQRIIAATKDRPDAVSIHSMLLRSMMQANYSADNIGHFGLAYDEYSHFTSPIRRYPDLMLHRAIKDFVTNKKGKKPLYKSLDEAGEHTSMTERRAEEASREVETWLKCHYMKRHVGNEFSATITTVTNFGVFVTLNELFIDGLIHISHLGEEYFTYDEKTQQLIGERGSVFGLGDLLTVQVAGVNMDLLQIDFALVEQLTQGGNAVSSKKKASKSRSEKAEKGKKSKKKARK
ncbi:ribonuclease R [Moraxella caviae]|uniref:Ribonuclease R n=1 Tax=Moraxella caviae TaxID=34060 RepID=A0A1T0A718_9GAMM|nr:ribonuclease R [Moraxella caviae]OOR91369.1 ribonuclease R [Moraxella caviae]STZ13982.1 Ribonuclease R [Moraxella caviae]VEW11507.1 Ribonuclease R [Moraxella caviae]